MADSRMTSLDKRKPTGWTLSCAAACVLLISATVVRAETSPDGLIASSEPGWPQWRGPRRDGVSDEKGLLQTVFATLGPTQSCSTDDSISVTTTGSGATT